MTDDNSNLVDMDNLDNFEEVFYEAKAEVEEVVDTEEDALATDEDKDASAETEDETETPDEEPEDEATEDSEPEDEKSDDEEDEEEPKPEGKGKQRKSAQERINEITRRARESEREAAAAKQRETELLRRLEALEARERDTSKEGPITEKLPQGAPSPDAVGEDGKPLYPLGEFDPLFVRDLTRFTITEETKAIEEKRAAETQAQELARAKQELQSSWQSKLDEAEEEIPEIRDHIVDLVETFRDVEPAYGEYIAMTIMQSENGPQIMEYLSQNIGEAQKIVNSGASAATLAIGRLDARLARKKEATEEKQKKNVSHAPTPPPSATKGRKGQASVRPDTDNLDAFEKVFYE